MSTAARSDTVSAPTEQAHFDAARQYQAYYDETLREVGGRAPQPTLGQTVNDYRREVCRRFKRTFLPPVHDLYRVNYRGLRSDALQALEPQLLQACIVEANNPNTVPPGEFRKIEVRNPYGQLQMTKFVGPECFVKQMGRPGRYFSLHDERTKSWSPVSPEEFRRRCYDEARRRGVTLEWT